jgi:protein-tyrosine-phosphatase
MAEALLRRRLEERGIKARVSSAGLLPGGAPATEAAIETMAVDGLDISEHISRQVSVPLLEASHLVITMTRQQLVELTVMAPTAWPRMFQIRDLVWRSEQVGPWPPSEPFADWLRAVGRDRNRSELLSAPLSDDVADPIGQSAAFYERTRRVLDDLLSRLATLV